jgi:AcrR family transcriptional regulator
MDFQVNQPSRIVNTSRERLRVGKVNVTKTKTNTPPGSTPRAADDLASASSGAVRHLMRLVSRKFLFVNMRAEPMQERAIATVERIMVAARQLALQHGADAVSINEVAAIADLPQMTVYRYFSSSQAMLRMLVRLRSTHNIQLFRKRMIDGQFESMNAFVETTVEALVEMMKSEGVFSGAPLGLRRRLYRDYDDIPLDELWDLADDVANTMLRSGLITRTGTTQYQIAMSLVSAIAMAKTTFLHATPDIDATMFAKAVKTTMLSGFLMLAPPSARQ